MADKDRHATGTAGREPAKSGAKGAASADPNDTPATREAREAGAALSTEQHTAATTPKLAPEQKGLGPDGKPIAKPGEELPEVLASGYDFPDGDHVKRLAPLTPVDEADLDEKQIEDLRKRGVIRRATAAEAAQIKAREGKPEPEIVGSTRPQGVVMVATAPAAKKEK